MRTSELILPYAFYDTTKYVVCSIITFTQYPIDWKLQLILWFIKQFVSALKRVIDIISDNLFCKEIEFQAPLNVVDIVSEHPRNWRKSRTDLLPQIKKARRHKKCEHAFMTDSPRAVTTHSNVSTNDSESQNIATSPPSFSTLQLR